MGVSLDFRPSWSSTRDRWETHGGRYYYDPTKAERAARFFPLFLSHHIGPFAGRAFELRGDQEWLIVRPLFGWRRAVDGLRRFRKLFAFCPKGWGKSPLGAGLGIYLARLDGEAAAEVYAIAADREQARIVHDGAKIMIAAAPELREGCAILKDAIVWPTLHARYVVIASDAATKHGFRPHGVIFDELHAIRNRDLYEAFRKSLAKRDQPLLIIISHAGTDDEGICYEEYELAKRVLQGSADLETTLPVIFEKQPDDDWQDPAVWRRVNPGHGTTVRHDEIVEESREAAAEPRKRNDFLRYHLNVWTNQATAWIPIEWWDRCKTTIDDAELKTLDVAAGLDLSQKWDLAAFVLVFKRPRVLEPTETPLDVVGEDDATGAIVKKSIELNYDLIVRPYFWIPEDSIRQHAQEDGIPYDVYRDLGLLTATEGSVIDYSRIYRDITTTIVERYPRLKEGTIAYDPAFATDLATKLRDLAGLSIVEVLQNYKMLSEACQIVEALIKGRRVLHDGQRVLRWCWENVAVKTDDAGRIRPVKPRNPAKRIDGAVALIMGQKALTLAPRAPEYSIYIIGGNQ